MNKVMGAALLSLATSMASVAYAAEPAMFWVAYKVVDAQGKPSTIEEQQVAGILSGIEGHSSANNSYHEKGVVSWDCTKEGDITRMTLGQDLLRSGTTASLSASGDALSLNVKVLGFTEQTEAVLKAAKAKACPASIHGTQNVLFSQNFTVPAKNGLNRFALDNGNTVLVEVTRQ